MGILMSRGVCQVMSFAEAITSKGGDIFYLWRQSFKQNSFQS